MEHMHKNLLFRFNGGGHYVSNPEFKKEPTKFNSSTLFRTEGW